MQLNLVKGTPEDVRNEFAGTKKILGKNGGWTCAPTHHIQSDTPMENFMALVDAVKKIN